MNKNFTDNAIPTEKPAESPTGNPEMVVRNRFPDDNVSTMILMTYVIS